MKITEYFECLEMIRKIELMAKDLDLVFKGVGIAKPYFFLNGEAVRSFYGSKNLVFYDSVEEVFHYLQGLTQGIKKTREEI